MIRHLGPRQAHSFARNNPPGPATNDQDISVNCEIWHDLSSSRAIGRTCVFNNRCASFQPAVLED
jgi:hypothetical protein